MLSYRHSFHAGNFADVIKHVVLVEILQHLAQKDTAFHFVDTHAGAGIFDLNSEHAAKLQEYKSGVGKLASAQWPELAAYFAAIAACNPDGGLRYYPGLPMFAMYFLRRQDRAWLYELHATDVDLLQRNIGRNRQISVKHEDGFKGLLAVLPPASRRGLVLMDPSFEVKSDFKRVVETVALAHRKFATGTYAIWYPVVERRRVEQLENAFRDTGIRNIQQFELAVAADSDLAGMTAAGMFVINPPWTLLARMSQLLPRLVAALAVSKSGSFRCGVLVDE